MSMPAIVRCVKNGRDWNNTCIWKPAGNHIASPLSRNRHTFHLLRGERYFCSGCGCPLWFRLTDTDRYLFCSFWTLPDAELRDLIAVG